MSEPEHVLRRFVVKVLVWAVGILAMWYLLRPVFDYSAAWP